MGTEADNISPTADLWAARWQRLGLTSLSGYNLHRGGAIGRMNAVSIGAEAAAGGAMTRDGASPPAMLAHDPSSFVPIIGGSTAAAFETASLLSVGAGSGPATASPVTASMTVTTDKTDYAPGSAATFIVSGVNSGSSITFQIVDLTPGINGFAAVYAPFKVTDGGTGDSDGRANGTVVAKWQVPSDGSATGARLQLTATSGSQTAITTFSDAPNKIVSENLNAGTPESVWSIHGSIANQVTSDRGLCDADQRQRWPKRFLQDRYRFERLHPRYLPARLLRRQRRASRHDHALQWSG